MILGQARHLVERRASFLTRMMLTPWRRPRGGSKNLRAKALLPPFGLPLARWSKSARSIPPPRKRCFSRDLSAANRLELEMFLFRRLPAARRLRFAALRKLYKSYRGENTREARGLRLLRLWLSPCQREQFDGQGHFDVVGCDSGKKYRIHYGRAMNVHEIDEVGRVKMGWCFVPKGSLVTGDVMLAQKIALETFECRALAVANRCLIVGRANARRPST